MHEKSNFEKNIFAIKNSQLKAKCIYKSNLTDCHSSRDALRSRAFQRHRLPRSRSHFHPKRGDPRSDSFRNQSGEWLSGCCSPSGSREPKEFQYSFLYPAGFKYWFLFLTVFVKLLGIEVNPTCDTSTNWTREFHKNPDTRLVTGLDEKIKWAKAGRLEKVEGSTELKLFVSRFMYWRYFRPWKR